MAPMQIGNQGVGARQGRENREGFPGRLPSPGEPGEVWSEQLRVTNSGGVFARKVALNTARSMRCAHSYAALVEG
jgi:hypothetical protein